MLKIDLHTHILPERWPDLREKYGVGDWVRLEHCAPCRAKMYKGDKFFREVGSNTWDPAVRLGDCDRCGVTAQVLSTVPVMFSYWADAGHALDLSRFLNDHIAGIVREHPTRFAGLGTIPMQAPGLAVRELERCVKELGLAGVQIGSHVERPGQSDWNLSEPALFEIFAAAEALGAAVFVHPWDMMGKEDIAQYWLPWLVGMPAETSRAICSVIFGGVLERLPRLRIGFAHGGGSFPGTIGRIEHGFCVRPDLCAVDNRVNPREYLGRFYVDALVHDPVALRLLLEVIGEERIALGSDYPFPLGEACPGNLIESMGLPEATTARLLGGTALEFLGKAAERLGAAGRGASVP